MTITNADISFTFSGGGSNSNILPLDRGSNSDPDASLGGSPSTFPIVGKRLFDDVSEEQSVSGRVEYRCFYLNNLSAVETLWAFELYGTYSLVGDVTVELGFTIVNDKQRLKISNAALANGGSFILSYTNALGSSNFTVDLNEAPAIVPPTPPDPSLWALRFQNKIREISGLEDVTVSVVTGNYVGNDLTFEITFSGTSGKRYHNILSLNTNALTSASPTTFNYSFTKIVNGGPINRVADEIDAETTTPSGLEFYDISVLAGSPLLLGDLKPQDVLPIWVKRIVPPNCDPLENDGFTLQIKGSAIQP